MKAQASRGADFGYLRGNFIKKMRKMIPLLVPLFLVSLRRAQYLIEAMESRCYNGGKGRTYLRNPKIDRVDLAVLGTAFLAAAGAVILSAVGIDISIGGNRI